MKISFPIVYPITDTAVSGLSTYEQVERLIAGGAKIIQLREKKATSRDFYQTSVEVLKLGLKYGVRIIINDRVDIALVSGADGVHLGQEDLSPVDARRLLGNDAIIGFSTHTLDQVKLAAQLPIDYLAFGPIFSTSTKEKPDPVVGTAVLADVKRFAGKLPLIAIGGIDETNLRAVLNAGADSAAMIGAVLSDPRQIASKLSFLLSL